MKRKIAILMALLAVLGIVAVVGQQRTITIHPDGTITRNAPPANESILETIWYAILDDDGATVVRLIRENGIDINAPYYITIVGAVGSDPNREGDVGYATALSGAVARRSPNVVKALLDAGADVNARDRQGNTALASGFFADDDARTAIRLLINAGADLNVQDNQGNTALMGYADWGELDFVKILLDAGADVNIRNDKGLTALMLAEQRGNVEKTQLLRNARTYR